MQDSTTESTTIYPPYVHGIRAGTNLARFTPLKHVQTFQRHFSKENVQQAIEYLKQEDGPAPIFVTVDTRGTWSTEKGKLFWQATDGTTGKLQLVPKEELDDLIKKSWYDQKLPSGIISLWRHLSLTYIGITQSAVRKFVKAQKPWQMIAPKFVKGKERTTRIAGRPFAVISIDIADMVSFAQGSGTHSGNERYILVMVDNFSGFCLAEVQVDKEGPTTLNSFKKMVAAIEKLGFKPPRFLRSDKGSEFQGPGWNALNKKMGWRRELTSTYPAVRAERKIQTLKRYVRLNSYLTRGPGTKWWNVVDSSVIAVNRIYNKDRKASPTEIVRMALQELKGVRETMLDSREKRQIKKKPSAVEPKVGDSVRVSLLSEKELPRDYKGHLGYDRDGKPRKWTEELKTVTNVFRNKQTGGIRVKVDGKMLFWPSQVQVVPVNTVPSAVWGQDGNIDAPKQRLGERHSSKLKVAKKTKSKRIKLDVDESNIIVGRRRRRKTRR